MTCLCHRYNHSVDSSLKGDPNEVLAQDPECAWTDVVMGAAVLRILTEFRR
jgi:hypothetical protein